MIMRLSALRVVKPHRCSRGIGTETCWLCGKDLSKKAQYERHLEKNRLKYRPAMKARKQNAK